MTLHRHKVRFRPGLAEYATLAVVLLAVVFMLAGPASRPASTWKQVPGAITSVYFYQHASSPDGKPYRVQLAYGYVVDGTTYTGDWDGEWPAAHSPNALPADALDRLRERDFPLVVLYDAQHPARSSLHLPGDRLTLWWVWLALGLSALVFWILLKLYPRWIRRA